MLPIAAGHLHNLGVHVDVVPFVVALVVTATVLLLGTAALAVLTTRSLTRQPSLHRTEVVGGATRAGLPLAPAIGTSLALERAPARNGRNSSTKMQSVNATQSPPASFVSARMTTWRFGGTSDQGTPAAAP